MEGKIISGSIDDPSAFGKRLQIYREQAGLTQQEIADIIGVSKNHISSIERGVHKCNVPTLAGYAMVCGVSMDELAGCGKSNLLPELQRLLADMSDMEQKRLIDIIKVLDKY